jgi:hypothetical protein
MISNSVGTGHPPVWNHLFKQWDYLVLTFIAGLYTIFGAVLVVTLMWFLFQLLFSSLRG